MKKRLMLETGGYHMEKIIRKKIGDAAMMEQLAEECSELAHAALKYARHIRGENPVDPSITRNDLEENLLEEAADVSICLGELGIDINNYAMWPVIEAKYIRFKKRMENIKTSDSED